MVNIAEPGKSVGNFTLEAFLPGDANGDGTVDQTDLSLIKTAYGTATGQANFNPAADFNADGHVGCIDLHLAELNLGSRITYNPPVTVAAASIPAIATPAPATTTAQAVTTVAPASTTTTTTVAASSSASSASAASASSASAATASSASAATTTTSTTTTPVATTGTTTAPVAQTTPVATAQSTPYLAYVYPQSGAIVPIAAPTVETAATPSPVYYYGQPVVQSSGFVSASQPASQPSTATAPLVVYYSNPPASTQAKSA